ncbi:MAG: response regulator [Deltaproteobacteria bacterium]|nr:response regulator [Deltaproteobacteria bacterium]
MSATVSMARPTVLVIHDDADALDVMTRLFEASGCEVVTAVTGFRAQALLEGDRPVSVVVAPWDAEHPVGGEVYRWSLQRRYDLRDQFVFVSSEIPADFDRMVAGRCLSVSMDRPAEIVRVALAAVKRRTQLEATRDALEGVDTTSPRLLLADDEPVLLMVIGDFLVESGFAVTRVESGHAAIVLLHHEDFDTIVSDWQMDDGSGADLYTWIVQKKPELAERIVFLSDGEGDEPGTMAPGRPMFRKGQDSRALTSVLHEIVRQVRGH